MERDYFRSKVVRPPAVDGAFKTGSCQDSQVFFRKEAGVNRPSLPERFSVFLVFPQARIFRRQEEAQEKLKPSVFSKVGKGGLPPLS